jgi:hypothetical protein
VYRIERVANTYVSSILDSIRVYVSSSVLGNARRVFLSCALLIHLQIASSWHPAHRNLGWRQCKHYGSRSSNGDLRLVCPPVGHAVDNAIVDVLMSSGVKICCPTLWHFTKWDCKENFVVLFHPAWNGTDILTCLGRLPPRFFRSLHDHLTSTSSSRDLYAVFPRYIT